MVNRSQGEGGTSRHGGAPTRGSVRRRRLAALTAVTVAIAVVAVVVSALAPGPETSRDGYHIVHDELKSKAVGGRELGYTEAALLALGL